MSDGPYRTLNMSPKWKASAKLAGNVAHSPEEVAEAIPIALASDWREIRPKYLRQVRAALGDAEPGVLLPGVAEREVQRLRSLSSNPMEALLADNAQDVLRDGSGGGEAFREAIVATLVERADRGVRQIEEHYRRETSQGRAEHVRVRLTTSVGAADLRALANALAAGVSARELNASADRSGIDMGVSL